MKKIYLILLGCILLIGCTNKYNIMLIDRENITSIEIDSLKQNNNLISIKEEIEIDKIYNIFKNKTTNIESNSDNPNNPEELYYIKFTSNNKAVYAYIYKKDNTYYIEQPYNGIYIIKEEEFNIIKNYY